MSLISSLNIAQQALSVNQAAITVISNNVANVDNADYSKLSVELASVVNYTPSAGNALSVANSLSGVELTSVNRATDRYQQQYYWEENSTYAYLSQYSSVASNIEDIVNELNDTGISEAITNFYSAINSLTDDPTDITARQNYVSAAENLCYTFNTTHNSLTNIQQSLVGDYEVPGSIDSSDIADQISEVNTLLDQLASVNESIIKTNTATYSSTSLLDQRDGIVNKLTALIPAKVNENNNGTVNISLGKYDLLSSTTVTGYLNATTGTATQPAVINIIDPDDNSVLNANINSSINSGSIGGVLDVCSGVSSSELTVSGVISQLNTLASTFAAIMNNIQTGDPNGDESVAVCLTSDGSELQAATENIFTSASASSSTTSTSRATLSSDVAGTTISTALDSAGNATNTTTTMVIDTLSGQTTITTTISSGISAGNIGVNSAVTDNPYLVAAGRLTEAEYADFGEYVKSVGNNDNSTIMMNSRDIKYGGLGNLTIENFLSSSVSEVGNQVAGINSNLENETLVLDEIKNKLRSATGVNLDEELVDLIKYQRAYQAAARVFSICNELLGDLIHLGN